MRRRVSRVLAGAMLTSSCAATTHYARRPEAERSSHVAASTISQGMTLDDVVVAMIHARLIGQYAALASGAKCPEASTKVILHAGELLARAGHTKVYAGGYASIEVYHRADGSLSSHGFERQGALLEAVHARQKDILVCSEAYLSFDATVEGGCGEATIPLTFGVDGRLDWVGPVTEGSCGA